MRWVTEVNLELVNIAGTEYAMEDDILCFLPTVSDLDVFGCELELLDLREQQPLSEAFARFSCSGRNCK